MMLPTGGWTQEAPEAHDQCVSSPALKFMCSGQLHLPWYSSFYDIKRHKHIFGLPHLYSITCRVTCTTLLQYYNNIYLCQCLLRPALGLLHDITSSSIHSFVGHLISSLHRALFVALPPNHQPRVANESQMQLVVPRVLISYPYTLFHTIYTKCLPMYTPGQIQHKLGSVCDIPDGLLSRSIQ